MKLRETQNTFTRVYESDHKYGRRPVSNFRSAGIFHDLLDRAFKFRKFYSPRALFGIRQNIGSNAAFCFA